MPLINPNLKSSTIKPLYELSLRAKWWLESDLSVIELLFQYLFQSQKGKYKINVWEGIQKTQIKMRYFIYFWPIRLVKIVKNNILHSWFDVNQTKNLKSTHPLFFQHFHFYKYILSKLFIELTNISILEMFTLVLFIIVGNWKWKQSSA